MAQIKADLDHHPDGDRILITHAPEHNHALKDIPGAGWDKVVEQWFLPLRWTSCVAMQRQFGADFVINQELQDWGQKELVERVGPSLTLRDRLDLTGLEAKPGDRSSDIASTVADLGAKLGLFGHQIAGAAWIGATRGQSLVLDEQGTGKTAQVITGIRALQRHGESMFPVLVVCPATVKTHWERSWNEWYPGLKVVKVGGSAVQRRKQLSTPAHVYVINYDLMPKHSRMLGGHGAPALKKCKDCKGTTDVSEAQCQVHHRELNDIRFGTVVVDEAQRITNAHSTWSRSIWANSDRATHRIAMTGTPIQDTLEDYWALLRFAAPEEFVNKTKFLDRYALVGYNHFGIRNILGMNPARADEFDDVTRPFMRRMLKKVVLPFLPPVMAERRSVDMAGPQAKAYRDMKKAMMAELDATVNGATSTTTFTVTSPLTKATRLMQLASSFAEVIDPSLNEPDPNSPGTNTEVPVSIKLKLPSNKVAAFMDDLTHGDFDGNAGVVVFAQSRQILEMLSKEMTAKKIEHGRVVGGMSDADRDKDIDAFQNGDFKYILVSIQAGGAGLTLTAADTMVFLQRSWSSVSMSQAKARADRIGSQIHQSIRLVDYVSEGTVEQDQLNALEGKGLRIEEILKDNDSLYKWLKETA